MEDNFKVANFVSERHWHKSDAMEELANILNGMGDITVVDIEKEWRTDTNISDYKPRLILEATILYKVNITE